MFNYESGFLRGQDSRRFKEFLEKEIGTYYEINSNEYLPFISEDSYTVFELTSKEVDKIRDFEKSLS